MGSPDARTHARHIWHNRTRRQTRLPSPPDVRTTAPLASIVEGGPSLLGNRRRAQKSGHGVVVVPGTLLLRCGCYAGAWIASHMHTGKKYPRCTTLVRSLLPTQTAATFRDENQDTLVLNSYRSSEALPFFLDLYLRGLWCHPAGRVLRPDHLDVCQGVVRDA